MKYLIACANGDTVVLDNPTVAEFNDCLGGKLTGVLVADPNAKIGVCAQEDRMAVNDGILNAFASALTNMHIVGDVVIVKPQTDERGVWLSPWSDDSEASMASMEGIKQTVRKMNVWAFIESFFKELD